MALARDGSRPIWFRDMFCEHFWITTSGFFSDPALLCCVHGDGRRPHPVLGRLSVRGERARHRMAEPLPLCAEDKAKIMSGNAKRLLKM